MSVKRAAIERVSSCASSASFSFSSASSTAFVSSAFCSSESADSLDPSDESEGFGFDSLEEVFWSSFSSSCCCTSSPVISASAALSFSIFRRSVTFCSRNVFRSSIAKSNRSSASLRCLWSEAISCSSCCVRFASADLRAPSSFSLARSISSLSERNSFSASAYSLFGFSISWSNLKSCFWSFSSDS